MAPFRSKPKVDQAPVTFTASAIDKSVIARSLGVEPEVEPDVFEFLSRALDAPLPHPWTEHADKKGRVFFWNPASRHSSWQHPLTPSHKSLVASYRRVMQEEPEDRQAAVQAELEAFRQQIEEEVGRWRQSHAPDGTPYFYKIGTQLTRWDNPRDELVVHMDLRSSMLAELAFVPVPTPEEQADMERTVAGEALADASAAALGDEQAGALMDTADTSAIAAAADPAAAAITDGTLGSAEPVQDVDERQLDLTYADAEQEQQRLAKSGSRWNVLGRMTRRRRGGASDAGDSGSEQGGSPVSDRSGRSTRSRSGRFFGRSPSRSGDRASPKDRHMQELAAGRLGRMARRWVRWHRAKRYEAALCIQRAVRAYFARILLKRLKRRRQRDIEAMDPVPPQIHDLQRTLNDLMTNPMGRPRVFFDRSVLYSRLDDADMSKYIIPDDLALQHGMNFDVPMDMAAFNIIKPILLRPLPLPWRVLVRETGRVDYYHAGVREERRRHPLHAFFGELITFLRAHSHTNVPLTEPLAAQIFREASPQFVRQRLGVWEGPHADPETEGVRFSRLVKGHDGDCAEGQERRDDPRLEAAASVLARIDAWRHLWNGFAPSEPFPFLEGRLAALAAQISECAVVAPGAASQALLAQLAGAAPEAVLAGPTDPVLNPKKPEVLPLTPEEEAMQPIVTGLLGKAYGAALALVAEEEAGIRRAAEPPRQELEPEEVSEGSYTEIGEDEEYEDSFADEAEEEGEESEEASQLEEDLSEDLSGSTTAPPASGRRPMADYDELGSEIAPEDGRLDPEIPVPVKSFLPGYREKSATDWATEALRPMTPKDFGPGRDVPSLPGSPGQRPWNRTRYGVEQQLWSENSVLAEADERLQVPGRAPGFLKSSLAAAAAAGEAPETSEPPVSVKVPLSPSDRKRATEAVPHIARPMEPEVLEKLREEQRQKVDAFSQSLFVATKHFDECAMDAEVPDGLDSPSWRGRRRNAGDAERYRTGRGGLKKPDLPLNQGGGELEARPSDDIMVLRGCVARPTTPSKGAVLPMPPYLGAVVKSKRGAPKAWPVLRSRSTEPVGTEQRRWPTGPIAPPRPRSAAARARKPCAGLLPQKQSVAAETAAQSCRRFLSRTCGTLQAALATFDPTGDGKFNRWEWEEGLKKLGYDANYDVQEIFTVLDKRRHHVLTFSDLLDHYQGVPIDEGLPDPGVRGLASEITHEAMMELMGPVITEVLTEMLAQELLAPRGPPNTLPDVNKWLRKQELIRKQKARDKKKHPTLLEGQEDDGTERRASGSPPRSPGSSRRRRRRGENSAEVSPGGGGSPTGSRSPGRKKKTLTKFRAVGQIARMRKRQSDASLSGSQPLSPMSTMSSFSATSTRTKGMLGMSQSMTGTQGLKDGTLRSTGSKKLKGKVNGMVASLRMSGTRGSSGLAGSMSPQRRSPQQSPKHQGSRRSSPNASRTGTGAFAGTAKSNSMGSLAGATMGSTASGRRLTRTGTSKTFDKSQKEAAIEETEATKKPSRGGQRRRPPSQPQRRAPQLKNKYAGYNFVDNETSKDEEMESWERESKLPWMPRPTEEICKTYGHVFRMLQDPRARRAGQRPQKRSVHLSVPRMPAVPPQRGGGGGGFPSDPGGPEEPEGEEGSDAEEDVYDGLAPPPSLGMAKKWGARSSPDLFTGHSGLSTTAGTWRPGSSRSDVSEEDPDRLVGVSLPSLSKGSSPSKGQLWSTSPGQRGMLGSRIDAAARRRVPV